MKNLLIISLIFLSTTLTYSQNAWMKIYLKNTGNEPVYVSYLVQRKNSDTDSSYVKKAEGWAELVPEEKLYITNIDFSEDISFSFVKKGGVANYQFQKMVDYKIGVDSILVDPVNRFKYGKNTDQQHPPSYFIWVKTSLRTKLSGYGSGILNQTFIIESNKSDIVEPIDFELWNRLREELKAKEKQVQEEMDRIYHTSGILKDNRDGKEYKTTKIGDQIWMAENLNFKTKKGSYTYITESNTEAYGRLYNWETSQDVCPNGWHLPSDEEWKQMEVTIGVNQSELDLSNRLRTDQAYKLKAKKSDSKFGWGHGFKDGGTNEFNFFALPGGLYRQGQVRENGSNGYFWTSSGDKYSISAWSRGMYSQNEDIRRISTKKDTGLSVRCIKN